MEQNVSGKRGCCGVLRSFAEFLRGFGGGVEPQRFAGESTEHRGRAFAAIQATVAEGLLSHYAKCDE